MPGFAIGGAAEGREDKLHIAEFRRKHRWRVADLSSGPVTGQDFLYLKTASRPSFTLEEAIVHHDQEQAYFAGKQSWEPLVLTFYDAVGGQGVNDISKLMYEWTLVVANIPTAEVNAPSAYKKTLLLQSTAADGSPDESWQLFGAWPSKSNWSDLSYETNGIQVVEMTVRFDRAERKQGDA